jgi:hypothetical protein
MAKYLNLAINFSQALGVAKFSLDNKHGIVLFFALQLQDWNHMQQYNGKFLQDKATQKPLYSSDSWAKQR